MGRATGMAPEQLLALGRVAKLPQGSELYLAGGTGVAFHFAHRTSEDLDLFSRSPDLDLATLRASVVEGFHDAVVQSETAATLRVVTAGAAIDFVRYPYALLEEPTSGSQGVAVAGVLDLAVMKLAAIARRGIRRDFWDLYVIARSGLPLHAMAEGYVRKFGRAESDLYHVLRSLTYFGDANRDPLLPRGMTSELWAEVCTFFECEAPTLLRRP